MIEGFLLSINPEEPFMLFLSKGFIDEASKTFSLGLVKRKPLVDICRKMNLNFVELSRDEAQRSLMKIAEAKGMSASISSLIKNLALAFFLPTGVLVAMMKKVLYRDGVELNDFVVLDFFAEIPRAFRPAIIYHIWLFVPKSEEGGRKAVHFLKELKTKVGRDPLSEEEWRDAEPIREKLSGKIEIKGLNENLWNQLE
ncbi:MAG: hypothetical protein QXR98_05460 [Fervidicoccaceae archaeon]